MIQVENLSKYYDREKAVENISFTINDGDILGFLGPNGAGKTTTMKMLTGYMPPTNGKITVDGLDLVDHSIEIRKRIGYLPESAPLYPDMNVLDFLNFICEMREIFAHSRSERLKEIVKVCGLENVTWKDIGELSKGYRQRVGLAQALIHDPDFIILDEPTSGLDPNQIVEIRNVIKEIGKKKTIILSPHILPEVQATCNRIIIIHQGKIVADGSIDEITSGFTGRQQIKVMLKGDGSQIRERIKTLQFITIINEFKVDSDNIFGFTLRSKDQKDVREPIFDWVVQNGWKLLGLQSTEKSLEDVFREITLS
jgi:ABC-2 type transport system ATP-binding protein